MEGKRSFAYIPDNPDLSEYMTGIKYLNFIADIFGISAKDRQMCIRKYGDLFEMTGELAQPIAAYSHGMKQMPAIISAWLHQPGWILGFCGYMSCFVGVNLFISVLAYLWLRKKGVAILGAL